jgi:hypothetical protein
MTEAPTRRENVPVSRAALRAPIRRTTARAYCAIMALALSLEGCGGLELNPLTNERRMIRVEQDRDRTLTVSHELVLDDKRRPVHELRLPAGTYAFEGEDDDYWYLRSSSALGMVDYHRGGQTDRHGFRGGIALGKYSTRSVPAAAYIDGEGAIKVLIWKLGKEFMGGEDRDWRKSF